MSRLFTMPEKIVHANYLVVDGSSQANHQPASQSHIFCELFTYDDFLARIVFSSVAQKTLPHTLSYTDPRLAYQ